MAGQLWWCRHRSSSHPPPRPRPCRHRRVDAWQDGGGGVAVGHHLVPPSSPSPSSLSSCRRMAGWWWWCCHRSLSRSPPCLALTVIVMSMHGRAAVVVLPSVVILSPSPCPCPCCRHHHCVDAWQGGGGGVTIVLPSLHRAHLHHLVIVTSCPPLPCCRRLCCSFSWMDMRWHMGDVNSVGSRLIELVHQVGVETCQVL